MRPYLQEEFANPSSIYTEGVKTKKAIESARQKIASSLAAHSDEIIFTSGGTEANNLALLGIFEAAKRNSKFKNGKPHVVTTNIEHPSILEVCAEIEKRGGEVTYVKVEQSGIVDPKEIQKSLKKNTVLVSVMYANNEIGTIAPIREIAKTIRHFKKTNNSSTKIRKNDTYPYFHTDASQVAAYLDLNVERLGVDFMTIDGSKIYGPRAAGFLFSRRHKLLEPIIFGGGHESGRRSGTENPAAIVGLATALELTEKEKTAENKRLLKLREYFIDKVLKNFPQSTLNGDRQNRLPNNINICFPNLDAELAVLRFDAKGVAISSVTSCRNIAEDSSSYVIEAIGKEDCAKSSLRISLGRLSTKAEIDKCLAVLYNVVNGGTD